MKARNLALVALLALGTSAASFAATDADALRSNLDFNLTDNGNLNVTVKDGVAHIFGYAHAIDIAKAKRVAQNAEGINSVVISATSIN